MFTFQNSPEAENGIVARAWRDGGGRESPSKCPVESISDIYNIQRLKVSAKIRPAGRRGF